MLLGLAIGDSLGNTTEGQLPSSRRDIRYYEPNRYAGGRAVGVPSACRGGFQTRHYAFSTLEHLLEHDRIVPEQLLATFASRRIFGIGHTVAAACEAFRAGRPWYEAAQSSAGNGALMRIAPVVLPSAGTSLAKCEGNKRALKALVQVTLWNSKLSHPIAFSRFWCYLSLGSV